ncbi:MAG: orotidine 5'-phosphate decarboxylase / HUMPS family protein, partial [Sulfolobales archaeon]
MIRDAVSRAQSKLMIAIDNPRLDLGFVADLVSSTKNLVAGFKIGTPFILSKGLKTLKNLIDSSPGTYFIADLKLGDIAQIIEYTVELVRDAGFNGVVVNAFMGYEGVLDRASRKCRSIGLELLLQVTFDHPASFIIDSRYSDIKKMIPQIDPSGLIVPASKTTIIRDLRETFRNRYVILSP